MMKKNLRFILFMLCIPMMLASCIRPDGEGHESRKEQPTLGDAPEHYYESVEYSYQTDVNVEKLLTGLDSAYLLLANKEYVLGADHAPASVVTLTCDTYLNKEVKLESRTAEALYEMMEEMHAAGVTDISVTSGYRTYSYQQGLFNQYLKNEMATISDDARKCFSSDYLREKYTENGLTGLDYADARVVVLSYSAFPGTSEHQTGLCLDFVSSGAILTTAFENTEAFAWLKDNAHKFGFILRYPKGKEDITGYTYEPWHYRFVGREAATDIYYGNLTLEEYLGVTNE